MRIADSFRISFAGSEEGVSFAYFLDFLPLLPKSTHIKTVSFRVSFALSLRGGHAIDCQPTAIL